MTVVGPRPRRPSHPRSGGPERFAIGPEAAVGGSGDTSSRAAVSGWSMSQDDAAVGARRRSWTFDQADVLEIASISATAIPAPGARRPARRTQGRTRLEQVHRPQQRAHDVGRSVDEGQATGEGSKVRRHRGRPRARGACRRRTRRREPDLTIPVESVLATGLHLRTSLVVARPALHANGSAELPGMPAR